VNRTTELASEHRTFVGFQFSPWQSSSSELTSCFLACQLSLGARGSEESFPLLSLHRSVWVYFWCAVQYCDGPRRNLWKHEGEGKCVFWDFNSPRAVKELANALSSSPLWDEICFCPGANCSSVKSKILFWLNRPGTLKFYKEVIGYGFQTACRRVAVGSVVIYMLPCFFPLDQRGAGDRPQPEQQRDCPRAAALRQLRGQNSAGFHGR